MKTILLIIMISGILISGCAVTGNTTNQETDNVQTQTLPVNTHEAVLQIDDMTCTSCALGVEYQLNQLDGVIDAKIIYDEGKGYITYDADKIDAETIAEASDVYPASVVEDTRVTR